MEGDAQNVRDHLPKKDSSDKQTDGPVDQLERGAHHKSEIKSRSRVQSLEGMNLVVTVQYLICDEGAHGPICLSV